MEIKCVCIISLKFIIPDGRQSVSKSDCSVDQPTRRQTHGPEGLGTGIRLIFSYSETLCLYKYIYFSVEIGAYPIVPFVSKKP